MQPVGRVISSLLRSHEPFPAWCVSRDWQVLAENEGGRRMMPGMAQMSPEQLIDLWFGPGPMREMTENWSDVLHAGVAAERRIGGDLSGFYH